MITTTAMSTHAQRNARMSTMQRFGHGAVERPTASQPLMQDERLNAGDPGCFGYSHFVVQPRHIAVAARVAVLFLSASPLTVIRRIGAVIVDAFDGMSMWTLAHVCVKRLKRFAPSIADNDSASAVVGIGFRGLVVASPFNFTPRTIFAGVRRSMRAVDDRRDIGAETSAALT